MVLLGESARRTRKRLPVSQEIQHYRGKDVVDFNGKCFSSINVNRSTATGGVAPNLCTWCYGQLHCDQCEHLRPSSYSVLICRCKWLGD